MLLHFLMLNLYIKSIPLDFYQYTLFIVYMHILLVTRAFIMKYFTLDGMQNRIYVFIVPEGCSPRSRRWRIFSEDFLLGMQVGIFGPCPRLVFPLRLYTPGVCLCIQISSCYWDTGQI